MCRLRVNFVASFSILLVLLTVYVTCNDDQTIPVVTVAGLKVTIPCNITPSVPGDQHTLVLWYKDDSETPFYSLDNRTGGGTANLDPSVELEPQHFVSDNVQNRAYFNFAPNTPRLEIADVRASDAGLYRCRVDFVRSRTVNFQSRLSVIVPPEKPVIRNENMDKLQGLIGPYNEDDSLFLACENREGNPRPSVKWWNGPELLQGRYMETAGGLIRNDLIILKLTKKHYRMNLTCSASNNNMTQPPSTDIQIDMNFKPKTVEIVSSNKPMSTKKINEIICKSTGSIPPARISWWKGTKRMKGAKYYVSDDNNGGAIATSVLRYQPTNRDNGAYLACRAHNPRIDDSAKEDGFKMKVQYPPELTLSMQSDHSYNDMIKEGTNVFMSCSISANPAASKIQWLLNGKILKQNLSQNIIISRESLHLRNVNRNKNGDYSCFAENSEGKGMSNTLSLRVKYAPVCKEPQTRFYGASINEMATVFCEVEADPPYVEFKWVFNNSKDEFKIIDHSHKGLTSQTKYIPRSDLDFGNLFCTATNKIGEQTKPCVFTVVFAAPPDNVNNCSVVNQTSEALEVQCTPGENGGLPQTFIMEVYDTKTHKLLSNVSSEVGPQFTASDLPADMTFLLIIYSTNGKGRSHSRTLSANTLKFTQRQTSNGENANEEEGSEQSFIINPILAILIGVVASLVIIAIIIVISMRVIAAKQLRNRKKNSDHIKTHIPFQTTIIDQDFQQYERKDPDIIPARNSVNDSGYEDFAEENGRRKKNNELPYEIVPQKLMMQNNSSHNMPKNNKLIEEVAYAELSLPPGNKQGSNEVIRRQERPTEYATIDFHKKSQQMSPSPHHSHEDSDASPETPLMNNKLESTV